jgi:hypothetical protein
MTQETKQQPNPENPLEITPFPENFNGYPEYPIILTVNVHLGDYDYEDIYYLNRELIDEEIKILKSCKTRYEIYDYIYFIININDPSEYEFDTYEKE